MHFSFSLHDFSIQCLAMLVMLAILSILIIVHEFGHFIVARLFGFQTPVCGFGLPFFGPHWIIARKWGIEFRLHALLLGGYVAIPELGDESKQDSGLDVPLQPFKKFPIWQRILVAFAGPAFNVIFAYFVMIGMLTFLGEPTQSTSVYSLVKENPIASQAGVLPGDEVLSINDQSVSSPSDAVKILQGHKDELVQLHIKRTISGQSQNMNLSMRTSSAGKVGMALVGGAVTYRKPQADQGNIIWLAAKKLWYLTVAMCDALGQLFSGISTVYLLVAKLLVVKLYRAFKIFIVCWECLRLAQILPVRIGLNYSYSQF